ncbi:hypothetical protein [uncultured Tenacibaculum sp.]|uniref:hypothetical protein n=1 Tax=uncultured Tenacibaculum sp. TaxID=174713 RepID=UPI002615C293|nr:hypothetical protein [uncultured Tenacibaculum sp.]
MYLKKITLSVFTIFMFIVFTAFTENIELVTKSLIDNRIELKVPKNFKLNPQKLDQNSKNEVYLEYKDDTGLNNLTIALWNKKTQRSIDSYRSTYVKTSKDMFIDIDDDGVLVINNNEIGYIKGNLDNFHFLKFFTYLDKKILEITFTCKSKELFQSAYEIMHSLKLKSNLSKSSLKFKNPSDISEDCAVTLFNETKSLEQRVKEHLLEYSFDVNYSVQNGKNKGWYRQTLYVTNLTFKYASREVRIVYDKKNDIPGFYYESNIGGRFRSIYRVPNFSTLAIIINANVRSKCYPECRQIISDLDKFKNITVRETGTNRIILDRNSMSVISLSCFNN